MMLHTQDEVIDWSSFSRFHLVYHGLSQEGRQAWQKYNDSTYLFIAGDVRVMVWYEYSDQVWKCITDDEGKFDPDEAGILDLPCYQFYSIERAVDYSEKFIFENSEKLLSDNNYKLILN